MSPTNLFYELWAYVHTKEYREGIFVEASGMVLDVLLLLVGVKLVAYYLARQSRNTTSFASSFFISQFLREVVALQLKTGGVGDINATLKDALTERKIASLFSHPLYGNIENLLDLLRFRMNSGEHIVGHNSLTIEERKTSSKEAQAALERLDNLLVMLASLRQEDQCVRAYEFRLTLAVVSDYLEELSGSAQSPPPRTYAPMSTALASAVETWFRLCKRVLDRQHIHQVRRSYVQLVVLLPWMMSYRFVVRRWQRVFGRPYVDPFSSNFPQVFCGLLAQALGNNWREAVVAASVNKSDLQLLISQHKYVPQETCISLLKQLRPHIDPALWNGVLAVSVTRDVDSMTISVATVDAVKASAIYYLATLAVEDDQSSRVIQQALQSLWNLGPSVRRRSAA